MMRLRLLLASILLAMAPAAPAAVELFYQPQRPPELPKRRLMMDPAQPAGAPSAQAIEVARIQDGPEDALYAAARALSLSHAAYGRGDARLIVPRINHAYAQLWAGRGSDAVRAFSAIVEATPNEHRVSDDVLLEAWYGLGSAQYAYGLYGVATESFAKALSTHRRKHGLHRPEQLDILAALAMAEFKGGDLFAAEATQKRRIRLAERAAVQDGAIAARHLTSVGRWYRELGRLREATDLHDRALILKARSFGPESPEVVSALLDLGLSFGRLNRARADGRPLPGTAQDRALNHAMRIVSSSAALPDAERARLTNLVADTNWLLGRRKEALLAYESVAAPGNAAAESFSVPDFLAFDPPPTKGLSRTGSEQIVATFSVDVLGRARDIRLSMSEDSALGQELVRALKAAKLRPAMQNGKPVATREVRYRLVPTEDRES